MKKSTLFFGTILAGFGIAFLLKKYLDRTFEDINFDLSDTQFCCFGHGLWYMGDPVPMGPLDAADGMPTKECPTCHANSNPVKQKKEKVKDEIGKKNPKKNRTI